MGSPLPERFWARVNKEPGGCWLWTGALQTKGYGQFHHCGRHTVVHRLAYEDQVGPIPEGLTLDHLCRVRHCVNPDHLEPVTNKENLLRGVGFAAVNARKTHCKRGHEFTPENTRRTKEGRACRQCQRDVHDQRRKQVVS